jgi:hypothetical protein
MRVFNPGRDYLTVIIERERSMSFFGKAKCFIGVHDWSSWDYKSAGHCEQQRRCSRCQKSEERVDHAWSDFAYVAEGRCDQSRKCQRCGADDARKQHAGWTEWDYQKPDNCHQEHACTRCAEREGRTVHVWGPYEFAGPKTCDQVRYCKRCKEGHETKLALDQDHTWHAEQRINCHEMRSTCDRCGQAKSREGEFHRFGAWAPAQNAAQRRCQDCGKVETGPAAAVGKAAPGGAPRSAAPAPSTGKAAAGGPAHPPSPPQHQPPSMGKAAAGSAAGAPPPAPSASPSMGKGGAPSGASGDPAPGSSGMGKGGR